MSDLLRRLLIGLTAMALSIGGLSITTPSGKSQAAEVTDAESNIEFIVGDRMVGEGGEWDHKDSSLKSPFGIDFDSSGDMYIVELGGGRVHRFAGGVLQTLNENSQKGYVGDGGSVTKAQFDGMHNCAITSDDKLLIADSWNHCVRQVELKTKIITTMAGAGEAGFGGDGEHAGSAKFDYLMCITLNPAKTILHVADLKNLRIRAIDMRTHVIGTVAGNGKKGVPGDGGIAVESPLFDPRAVASDGLGNIYVLERAGNTLRVVRPDGTIHTVAGTGEKGFRDGDAMEAQFAAPKHICCDEQGNVYIADDLNRAIRMFDPILRQVTTVLGREFGDRKIKLDRPHGVCWHDDTLYVVDTGHNRILRIR